MDVPIKTEQDVAAPIVTVDLKAKYAKAGPLAGAVAGVDKYFEITGRGSTFYTVRGVEGGR